MLLAIDVGNSQTAFGFWDGKEFVHRFEVATKSLVDGNLERFVAQLKASPPYDACGIASVVPFATSCVLALLSASSASIKPKVLSHEDVPMKVQYDDPSELGIDRLIISYAANSIYSDEVSSPILVVDFGTATTYNCVSEKGEFLGGCITLGIGSTLRALGSMTSQLPDVAMDFPDSALATNTQESIQAGVLFHAVGGMATLIMLYTLEAFGEAEPLVIVTGGYGKFMQDAGAEMDILDSDLLLKGIALIMERAAR